MGLIQQSDILKIKDAMRIEEVVGVFVPLKKTGASFKGKCPFHGGDSFTVTPAKNVYKCFGCGRSGTSITFLMEHKGMTYPEALRWLAQKFNVIIY